MERSPTLMYLFWKQGRSANRPRSKICS